jgi:hypothetical protein
VLVGVDDPRRRMVLSAQRFGEQVISRCCVAFSRQKEVDRRTDGVAKKNRPTLSLNGQGISFCRRVPEPTVLIVGPKLSASSRRLSDGSQSLGEQRPSVFLERVRC